MTISNASRTAGPFIGNGVTTDFPFAYKVFTRADLLVARTVTATGVETILVIDSDYTVILNTDQNTSPGGIIRMLAPLATGTTLAATSNLSIIQPLDLTNGGGFYPKVINDALDRIVINIQQLSAKIGLGSLNIGVAATIAAILATLSNFASAAGAASIGFIQNGIGAVLRTLQARLRDSLHVTDFGAKGDGVTNDSLAIQKALAAARLAGKTLFFPSGTYICDSNIVLYLFTSIWGAGQGTTIIKFIGTAFMQSDRPQTNDCIDLRNFTIQQGGSAPIGLDIGTVRQSIFQNLRVLEFLIGVNLGMDVNLVANYWNRLINITAAGPGKTVANSVGFNLGNNTNATYPDTDYNTLIGCKSFTYETGIRALNAIGCQVVGHQCTEVTRGLSFFNGNNCNIEMMVENSTNMGFADVNSRANEFYMYNDGGNATPFIDNGLNYVKGQLFDFPTFSSAMREGDSYLKDRIFFGGIAPTQAFFKILMDGDSGSMNIKIAYTGEVAGIKTINGVGEWDVYKPGTGSAPVVVLSKLSGSAGGTASFGTNLMTVVTGAVAVGQTITAAGVPVGTRITSFNFGGGGVGTECVLSQTVGTLATRPVVASDTIFTVTTNTAGEVIFTAAGHATNVLKLNAIVSLQGINGLSAYPYSRAIRYTRLVP